MRQLHAGQAKTIAHGASTDFKMVLRRRSAPKKRRGGFLKIPIGIPTYAIMKTGFHTDVSPKNWFPCQRQP